MDSPYLRGPRCNVREECWEILLLLFYKDAWKKARLQDGMISFSRLQVSVIKVSLLLQLYHHHLAGLLQTPINKGKMILRFYNSHVFQVLTGVPLNDYNPPSAR